MTFSQKKIFFYISLLLQNHNIKGKSSLEIDYGDRNTVLLRCNLCTKKGLSQIFIAVVSNVYISQTKNPFLSFGTSLSQLGAIVNSSWHSYKLNGKGMVRFGWVAQAINSINFHASGN